MQIGAVFPNPDIGTNPSDIRDYGKGVEDLGLKFIATYDHVVGADLTNRPDWKGPYSADNVFHEPLTLFAFLAASTSTVEFSTSIMVLPQRPTALTAKQAAEVALLSNNRLRLGVAIGWNQVEYEASSVPWEGRAKRLEEQVDVLRQLWANHTIDYSGNFHSIPQAGINPRPSKAIPIWLGGGLGSERALRRLARIGDGWMSPSFVPAEMTEPLAKWRRFVEEEGRGEEALGLEAIVPVWVHGDDRDSLRKVVDEWREVGATHVSIGTHGLGLTSVGQHLSLLDEINALVSG